MKTTNVAIGLFLALTVWGAPHGVRAADDIVDTAVKAGQFRILADLLTSAELVETLKGDGPFTVFAPTDEAFRKLPKGLVSNLKKPARKDELAAVLTYHVIPGKVALSDALKAGSAKTIQGGAVKISFSGGSVKINAARLQTADIECSNGIIHVIDGVLLPPEQERDPLEVIERAIGRGVPMFNKGDAEACADIYMAAAKTLVNEPTLDEALRQALGGIVEAADGQHSPKQRAWILRYGLNMVRTELHGRRM